ncbi:hypothetical protein [Synechococcus phage BUCT-ZZ01]|nr:hypothetical protein [Synechococcus phage BUCT-ZZ01]
MSERKMARVVVIDDVITHPNADSLDLAIVGGWQCVVKRGEYKKGDLAIYCEVDSWIPHTVAPFLTKPGQFPKVYNGVEGQKLKSIRLRGELSQGLILPLKQSEYDNQTALIDWFSIEHEGNVGCPAVQEGYDVSELLGIQKWEAPINPQLAGISKGSFPSQFPKTDQERIQNLSRQFEKWKEQGLTFTVQEKLEGSSMTCYLLNGEFGVCSRNLNLMEDENNTFWKVARELDIENKMRFAFAEMLADGEGVAIQGELIGPGIQGNIYGLEKPTMRVFDIVLAKGMLYYDPLSLRIACCYMGLETVPFLEFGKFGSKLQSDTPYNFETIQDIIEMAEGKSVLNPNQEREGLVFKCNEDPKITFKAISNTYLLKQKDEE